MLTLVEWRRSYPAAVSLDRLFYHWLCVVEYAQLKVPHRRYPLWAQKHNMAVPVKHVLLWLQLPTTKGGGTFGPGLWYIVCRWFRPGSWFSPDFPARWKFDPAEQVRLYLMGRFFIDLATEVIPSQVYYKKKKTFALIGCCPGDPSQVYCHASPWLPVKAAVLSGIGVRSAQFGAS